MRSIYLDYNSTTPLAPAAQEAMIPYLTDRFGDPQSDHPEGRAVGEALEDARYRLAGTIAADPHEIVWTSGATESCNLCLRGLIEPLARAGEKPHLVVSALDHAAVQGPARFLFRSGAELTVVPCSADGRVDPDSVAEALRPNTRLVSVVHANDEMGAIQPIAEIAALCHAEGVLVHTDAAQSFGKTPVSVEDLGVDLLSISGHKAYGPKGVGALYVREGVGLEPLIHGAGQESGLRGGMPNVAGIIGLGAAATLAVASVEESGARLARLRDRFGQRLLAAAGEGRSYGPDQGPRLPNTLCVGLPSVPASDLLAAVPELSATACAGGFGDSIALSGSLRAMGVDPAQAVGAIRFSIGWYTDEEQIDRATDALVGAWEQSR